MYVFGRRAWCRHLCPIGALLKVFSLVRPAKVRLKMDDCTACGKCARVCDMEVDVTGELERYGEVRSNNCVVCFKCIEECPQNTIAYTLRRTGICMSPEAADRAKRLTSKRRKSSAFDVILTVLWISVVLAASIAGVRQNAPQEVKVLMTPGLLLIFYGLAVIIRKVWEKNQVKQEMP
jgi:polyferredoxin